MKSPNELSFLPDDYLERKAQRRTNAICATLFFIEMVAISSAFVYTERIRHKEEQNNAAVAREYTEAAKQIEQVNEMDQKRRTMALQAELTASLLERVPRSFLLAEITNSMPKGVSLLDLTLESKKKPAPSANTPPRNTFTKRGLDGTPKPESPSGSPGSAPPPPEAKAPDVTIKITGIASTDVQVSQFISRLNQSKLLREVNLIISEEFKGSEDNVRKFQIEVMVNPNADVASIAEKPKVTAVELGK